MLAQANEATTQDEATVTAIAYLTVKEEMQQQAQDLFPGLVAASRSEEGCLAYVLCQEVDNPRQFALFEQWRDAAALSAHFEHLQELYGPPPEGRGIPAAIMNLVESIRGVRYRLVA